jgi:hypothetical protein
MMAGDISPKVKSGALAGAIVVVLVWLASMLGVDVPEVVQGALVVIVSTLAAYLVGDPRRV